MLSFKTRHIIKRKNLEEYFEIRTHQVLLSMLIAIQPKLKGSRLFSRMMKKLEKYFAIFPNFPKKIFRYLS